PADQPEPSTAAGGAAFSGPATYDLTLDDLGASDDLDEEAEPEELAQGEVLIAKSAVERASRDERKRRAEELDDRGASQDASGYEAAAEAGMRLREPRAQRSSAGAVGRHAAEEAEAPPPAAPAAAQAAPAPAPEPVLTELENDGADALRSQANPLDYRGDWYLREPSLDPTTRAAVAAAFAKAQSAIVAGDVAGAVAALSPLLASPHPMVAQDAAFRLATLQLQSGQIEMASATVRRGLAASGSPTVFRSRLLALQGSILEERGRPAEAVDSYRQAVEDNDARH
ncbi:MAG: tetratricopeptide repeat protein, partial [Pseudomonadota bacterium]